MTGIALAFLLVTGCTTEARLSSARPEAILAIRSEWQHSATLEIAEVYNPARAGITIAAKDDGPGAREERFSLYPPDAPASFGLRLSQGARNLNVRLIDTPRSADVQFLVRVGRK